MLATRSSSTTPIPGLPPPILPPIRTFGADTDPNAPPDCPCGSTWNGDSGDLFGPTPNQGWSCNSCPDWGGGFGLGPSGGPMPVGPDIGGGAVAPPGSWGGGDLKGLPGRSGSGVVTNPLDTTYANWLKAHPIPSPDLKLALDALMRALTGKFANQKDAQNFQYDLLHMMGDLEDSLNNMLDDPVEIPTEMEPFLILLGSLYEINHLSYNTVPGQLHNLQSGIQMFLDDLASYLLNEFNQLLILATAIGAAYAAIVKLAINQIKKYL
jgi:hypothetical protein